MHNDDKIALYESLLAAAESLLGTLALAAAIGGILIDKGLCTKEEIEEIKEAIYKSENIQRAMKLLEERKAQLEELKKEDPYQLFIDLFRDKGE